MSQGFHPQHFGQAQPLQPKKGMSGCLIALLVFAALGVAAGLGVGIYFYVEYKEFVDAAGEMAGLMADAEKTPGAKAMRKRGCHKAFALETAKLDKVAQRFENEMARREGRKPKPLKGTDDGWVLSCDVTLKMIQPSDVAKAFLDAQKPTSSVIVTVRLAFDTTVTKTERFSPAGASLGTAEAPDLPASK